MAFKQYKLTVMFDLDETLFTCRIKVEKPGSPIYPHLSKANQAISNLEFYMIYKEQTADMFRHLLLMPGVRIGFITAAEYPGNDILPFLEQEYGLPPNALKSALYINAYDLGDKHTLKGIKLEYLRKVAIFASREEVILVDDNLLHLQSALEYNFNVVHASGFFLCGREVNGWIDEFYHVDPRYLQDIRNAIEDAINSYNRKNSIHTLPISSSANKMIF